MIPREVADQYRDADPAAFTRVFGPGQLSPGARALAERCAPDRRGAGQYRRPRTRLGRAVRRLLRGEVGLTLMLAAVLTIPAAGIIFAPEASADPVDAYTAHYAGTICHALDEQPQLATITRLMDGMVTDGYAAYRGQIMIGAVSGWCPERYVLIDQYIATYGPQNHDGGTLA